MTAQAKRRWFTAFRFEQGTQETAQNVFQHLARNGFTPSWELEAINKRDPRTPRAILINLPKVEADKLKAYSDKHSFLSPA